MSTGNGPRRTSWAALLGSAPFWRCAFAPGFGCRNDAGNTHRNWITCGKRFAQAFVERFALVLRARLSGLVCLGGRGNRWCADVGHNFLQVCGSVDGGMGGRCEVQHVPHVTAPYCCCRDVTQALNCRHIANAPHRNRKCEPHVCDRGQTAAPITRMLMSMADSRYQLLHQGTRLGACDFIDSANNQGRCRRGRPGRASR